MNIMEKTAYLRGLVDGLELDLSTKEGKVITAMIDVLDEIAASISDLEDTTGAIEGELDEIAEELIGLEGDSDDCDWNDWDECDCADDCCDCGDEHCDCDCVQYSVECANCGEHIELSECDLERGEIKCSKCGETLEFDSDECDEPF